MIVKVMLTGAVYSLSREFDYIVPDGMEDKAVPGMRVIVPFGVRNNHEEAIITGVADVSKRGRLKKLHKFMDDGPVLSEEQLSLCGWMQKKYLCSFSQAYKQVRPPRVSAQIRRWIVLAENTEDNAAAEAVTPQHEAHNAIKADTEAVKKSIKKHKKLTENQLKLIKHLKACDGMAEYTEIAELAGIKNLSRTMYALADMGLIEICEDIKDSVGAKFIRMVRSCCSAEDAYAAADELYAARANVQANMLLTLADCGDMSCAELVSASDGNYTSLSALCDKGLAEVYKKQLVREVYSSETYAKSREYTPTEEQRPVIEHLNECISAETHEKILLRGVTGSGKTEVFLQAIRHCTEMGRQAIMLVPEISLTPQMVERFVSRFGDSVAVMHSGLSVGERYDQWNKIKSGKVNVAVGARSAIFAPFDNIGIIILDEEHESSYKSDISPRYHAADVAFHRGERSGAVVLLASATPDVATYHKALSGEYRLFEMNKRYNENDMPSARIVDMRSELFDLHNTSPISIRLREEIRLNLEKGEKTVLFLNRRGYNTFVSCRKCGEVIQCENCSIAMTYHKKADKLVCHYCGESRPNVKECPKCGSPHIRFFGTGTQKIEDDLTAMFPEARILRMDYDTTSQKGGHERILNKFRNGEADILLGTQMVTKGLDFPDVTLVGVLAADTALNVDDFRANEKCFSLITQVCGRAGRGDVPGRAVIQTYQPQNRTICYAKAQSYTDFYNNEIKYRAQMQYPPFADIICIMLTGEDEKSVETEMANIGEIIKTEAKTNRCILNIIGPSAAPIRMIKNKYRYRVAVKVVNAELLHGLLEKIYSGHEDSGIKNSISIDINPTSMI